MNATIERHSLPLETPFAIARGTTETAEVVAVRIEHDGETGLGAAAPSRRYGETPATVEAVLPELLDAVADVDPANRQRVAARLRETARGNPAARAAVAVACHDLAGRRLGAPLYELWGLDPVAAPATAFSLGIADPGTVADRAATAVAEGFDTLKVKLGAGVERDQATLAAVREAAPDATLLADANEGWNASEALTVLSVADETGVAFVEQPVPAERPGALRRVHEHSPVPVAVDEACRTAADVPVVADRADVVVVKVQKCGGPLAALEQVQAARAHGLDVMVGCMVESWASLAASVHLAPLAEYADLDGALLLAADPYSGIPMDGATFHLADAAPGTGARDQ